MMKCIFLSHRQHWTLLLKQTFVNVCRITGGAFGLEIPWQGFLCWPRQPVIGWQGCLPFPYTPSPQVNLHTEVGFLWTRVSLALVGNGCGWNSPLPGHDIQCAALHTWSFLHPLHPVSNFFYYLFHFWDNLSLVNIRTNSAITVLGVCMSQNQLGFALVRNTPTSQWLHTMVLYFLCIFHISLGSYCHWFPWEVPPRATSMGLLSLNAWPLWLAQQRKRE